MNLIDELSDSQLRRLAGRGFAFAVRMLHHREDAADMVQASLCKMLQNKAAFDRRKGSLEVWFLKIVRNQCLDDRRKKRPEANDETIDVASGQPPPLDQIVSKESYSRVLAVLSQLDEDSRSILQLRDFHDLRYAEIANVLDIPVGTVMSRLHRARLQLRELYLSKHSTTSHSGAD